MGVMLGVVTLCGITAPNGLLQLWRTCRSLRDITLAMDTRLYRVPFIVCIPWIDLSIDVVDSFIEAESVPAITAFFSKPHRVSFQLVIEGLEGWKCWGYHYTSRHPVQTSHPTSLRRCPRAWALPSQSSSATQA